MESSGTVAYAYLKSLLVDIDLYKGDKTAVKRVINLMERLGDNVIEESEYTDNEEGVN